MRMSLSTRFVILSLTLTLLVGTTSAQMFVPGTGTLIDFVGDTFEEGDWKFVFNQPKSSREQDERNRYPSGYSTNQRWFEGPERGYPDSMKLVETPEGGLEGSNYSLLVRTRNSGIPGRLTFKVQQDDLIVDSVSRIGKIPVYEMPSIVTRVWLPPSNEWEDRTGPHFGFRGTTTATIMKTEDVKVGRFRTRSQTNRVKEPYWPGIWIHFRSETDPRFETDSAFLTVRGNRLGHDIRIRDIPLEEFGWWTLGMSFSPDGRVHYFAKSGVENLTKEDHLTSQMPYSYRAETMENMFYNYCNLDNGRNWSTPFVIDDAQLFIVKSQRVVSLVNRKLEFMARQQQMKEQQQRTSANPRGGAAAKR